MKKFMLSILIPCYLFGVVSCTPQEIITDTETPQQCCGDDLIVPPKLPKPPIKG